MAETLTRVAHALQPLSVAELSERVAILQRAGGRRAVPVRPGVVEGAGEGGGAGSGGGREKCGRAGGEGGPDRSGGAGDDRGGGVARSGECDVVGAGDGWAAALCLRRDTWG